MIEAKQVSKYYEDIKALDQVSVTINEGNVFGLVGTNGAGKSTFMRILSGVLKADQGEITIDGHPVYENMEAKSQVFYISDDQYFFPSGTPADMEVYYRVVYPRFDHDRFVKMMAQFDLDKKRKLRTFSKGMKKQVSILLGICANTKYLFCDETFDGLDPVMRQAVKSLFAQEMTKRGMTPIIASHNLRELEDICDHVGLLHKGGILFAKDLEEMKIYIHKIQCVFREEGDAERAFEGLEILQQEQRGSLYTVTARGTREGILQKIQETDPLFAEVLPLSLEEIFISETEVAGYDIKKLVF
ncbi:MAG: ABC transporter ATP-binding protein [Lachnospiraceae bacterium]|nr:ABC transporter ATP-binding protein [Lachnospiraceae bacterium]